MRLRVRSLWGAGQPGFGVAAHRHQCLLPPCPQQAGFLLYDPKMASAAPVITTSFQHPKPEGKVKGKQQFSPRSDVVVLTEPPSRLIGEPEWHAHTWTASGAERAPALLYQHQCLNLNPLIITGE